VAAGSRRLWVAAGVLSLAAALAGCGDPSSGDGPLGPVEADGYVCITQIDHGVVTNGNPYVQNSSHTPAVIDRVGLANSRGLQLIESIAVLTSHVLYGAEPGYANDHLALPGFQWAQRRNAIGDVVRYSTPGTGVVTDLLFVLRPTASGGHASGVDIWYHVGSQHYHLRTVFGIYVAKCPGGSPSPSAS
jgi:hypothetical protein